MIKHGLVIYSRTTDSFVQLISEVVVLLIGYQTLLLLSTRPAVTFPAKEIIPFGWYQIMLLGDRGTQV